MPKTQEWTTSTAVTAAALNEPFWINGVTYDSGNTRLDVVVGPGRVDFGGVGHSSPPVVEKTVDTHVFVASPVINTTYFIFLNSAGNFRSSTSNLLFPQEVKLGSIVVGSTLTTLTRVDSRGTMPQTAVVRSHVRVYNNQAESINPGAWVSMPFNTVLEDTNSAWSVTNRRYTAPVTGPYLFDVGVAFNSGGFNGFLSLGKNRSNAEDFRLCNLTGTTFTGVRHIWLTAGDQVYPILWNGYSVQLQTYAGETYYWMNVFAEN